MTAWLYFYLLSFSGFLLGFSVFMHFEGRKSEDNQFTVKLLPPPAPREHPARLETREPVLEKHPA